VILVIALAIPFAAMAAPSAARMLSAINVARVAHGLAPLRKAASIQHASHRYARSLARHGQFRHARTTSAGHFKLVSEILGLAPGGGGMIGGVVHAWLKSPMHRPILLNRRYRYVGVGVARGRMKGRTQTFWVVRFA
jgi:uncharacterized protein YkwD